MEGAVGPPLVGESFLSNWSGRPLADLIEKTRLTMPFQLPMTLSQQESTDLVAYMLQSGEFPAGQAELSDATLAGIGFPVVAAAAGPGPTAGTASFVPAEGNLAELMRAIHFPNANIIFNVQLGDPATRPPREPSPLSFDYVEWGATIYPGWLAVDQAAVAIVETAPLLLVPGRRCQNGRPVPVDRADWQQYVDDMVEAGRFARRASQARDHEAFDEVSTRLNASCANCHMAYRDGDGPEGGGAARCQ